VVPTPVNEPLCTVDLASSPPTTWANRLRESVGLEPTFKTAWSDKARDERIAKQNACVERKSLHVVKLCDPPVPVGLTGRDFSAWIQEVQCLVCTACSKLHKLKELGNITKDKCDGRPGRPLAEGEPLLKRLASEARNAATIRHTGGIEITWGNALRLEAGLEPSARTMLLDKARAQALQVHNGQERRNSHRLTLDTPDVPAALRHQATKFNSWISATKCVCCTLCTKSFGIKKLERAMSDQCTGSPQELASLRLQQHRTSGKASAKARAKAAVAKKTPGSRPCRMRQPQPARSTASAGKRSLSTPPQPSQKARRT